jgi:hypothetical protein
MTTDLITDNDNTPPSNEAEGLPYEELQRAISLLKPSFVDPKGAAMTLLMMLRKRGIELVRVKPVT